MTPNGVFFLHNIKLMCYNINIMKQQSIKICGYDATYEEIENKCYIATKQGYITWEKTPDQVDHKPTNSLTGITAKNLISGVERTFLKENHIMITLKKAMDWVEKGPDEEIVKEELKTSPEPIQEVTEPVKEETKEETKPENTGGNQEDIRNPDGTIKKGHSLNPAGKPKGVKHFSTLFKEAIKNIAEGQTKSDDIIIVEKIISKAKEGDLKASEMVIEQVDGKATQELSIIQHRTLTDEERAELDKQLGV